MSILNWLKGGSFRAPADTVTGTPVKGVTEAPAAPPATTTPHAPLDGLYDALVAVAPHLTLPSAWVTALTPWMTSSGIITRQRIAMFLGQVAVESAAFTELVENLNYSAAALLAEWPSHFTAEEATAYARQPEKIANRAYANRMGNGDEASGDGWTFRGAGLVGVTGRDNHTQFAASVGKELAAAQSWMQTPAGAAASACWYWTLPRNPSLNALADGWEITEATRVVNGGLTDLAMRIQLCNVALKALS